MASLLPFSVKDVLTGTPAAAGDAAGPDALTSMWNNMFKDEAPDPWLPAMSRQQRVLGFFACLVGAAFCFGLSLVFLPMIYVKARKFAMLFSLGSLMAMGSVAMLRGPGTFVAQLVAPGQRVFSACYLGSLLGTLYCACVLRVTLATAFFGVIQIMVLLSCVVSYVPGGTTGLKFLFNIFYGWFRNVVWPSLAWMAPKCLNV